MYHHIMIKPQSTLSIFEHDEDYEKGNLKLGTVETVFYDHLSFNQNLRHQFNLLPWNWPVF